MNVKKILSLAVVLAMVMAIIPAFGLAASAAEPGGEYLVDTWYGIRYTPIEGAENIVPNPDFADGTTDGWTRALDGKGLSAWEVVENDDYSASASKKSIHVENPSSDGGSASAQTLRTFFEVTKGKEYLVSFNVYNAGNNATMSSNNSGMMAVVGVEKTGAGFGGYKEDAAGLKVYGTLEHGGASSWISGEMNAVEGTTLPSYRDDGVWQKGDNTFSAVIIIPETAENPYIMISLGAWGNKDLYFSNFSIKEVNAIPAEASVEVKVVDDVTREKVGSYSYTYNAANLYVGEEYTSAVADAGKNVIIGDYYYRIDANKKIILEAGTNEIELEAIRYKEKGSNIVPNPSFEEGETGWALPKGEYEILTKSGTEKRVSDGEKSLYLKGINEQAGTTFDNSWEITPGSSYDVKVDIMSTVSGESSINARFYTVVSGNHVNKGDSDGGDKIGGLKLNQFVTKNYFIDTDENTTRLGIDGNWFGNDAKPIFDNFRIIPYDRIPATVTVNFVDEEDKAIPGVDAVVYNDKFAGDKFEYDLPISVKDADGNVYIRTGDATKVSSDFVKSNTVFTVTYKKDNIANVPTIEVDARVNVAPKLPKTVTANLESGGTVEAEVDWPEVNAKDYTEVGGKSTIEGTVNGTEIKVTANVTVKEAKDFLVAEYLFDGDGNDTTDKYNAAVGENVQYVDDSVSGKAVYFPGGKATSETVGDNSVTLGGELFKNEDILKNKSFTISMDVKTDGKQAVYARLFDFGNGGYGSDISYATEMGNYVGALNYWTADNTEALEPAWNTAPDNEWTNITVTIDYNISDENWTATIYSNGEVARQTPGNIDQGPAVKVFNYPFYGDGEGNYRLGASNWPQNGDPFYKGWMDNVRIYSVALSPDEIKAVAPTSTVTVEYYVGDTNGEPVNTVTKTVPTGASVTFPAYNANIDDKHYSVEEQTYKTIGNETKKIVLTRTDASNVFGHQFDTNVAGTEGNNGYLMGPLSWKNRNTLFMAFDVPEGKALDTATLNYYVGNVNNTDKKDYVMKVYAVNPAMVDAAKGAVVPGAYGLDNWAGRFGAVEVAATSGEFTPKSGWNTLGIDFINPIVGNVVLALVVQGRDCSVAGMNHGNGAHIPYLSSVKYAEKAVEVPNIIAKLGWNVENAAFTIDYVASDVTNVGDATYRIEVTSDANATLTGDGAYDPDVNNGVGFVPADTNDTFTATPIVTVDGTEYRGYSVSKVGIYGLVMEAIANSKITGEMDATQLEAVNEVLKNGNLQLKTTKDKNGKITDIKLTDAAAKIMTVDLATKTITLNDRAANLGVRFATMKATDGTEGDAIVSEDGKSVVLSDAFDVAAQEAAVLSLESVYLEFVPTEIAESDGAGADAVQDFIPEL